MRRLVKTYLVRTFSSLVQKEVFFLFFFFVKFQKDIPNGWNALSSTDYTLYQKLATKIKAFQSAFEV